MTADADCRESAAFKLLSAAGVFFGRDEDNADEPWERRINLNDCFYWACCDYEEVPLDAMQEVADLFTRYGMCGIYYWVLTRRKQDTVEFSDINRFVEFVRNEERIRVECPSSSKRAYHKASYTIGKEPS